MEKSDIIVLSVLPQDFVSLSIKAQGKLMISLMAGVSTQAICENTQANQIIRCIPNAMIENKNSFIPWFASKGVKVEEKALFSLLFGSLGLLQEVVEESQIDVFTALTGSGHGWLAFFAQSLVDSAQNMGIEKTIAEKAVRQLFLGGGRLIAEEKRSPEEIVKLLKEYGGTTAAGLNYWDSIHLEREIEKGIQASYEKCLRIFLQ